MHSPMPTPSTSMKAEIVKKPVEASMVDMRNSPTAISSEPAMGKIL